MTYPRVGRGFVAATIVTLAACAHAAQSPNAPLAPPPMAPPTIAPSLGVDFAAMGRTLSGVYVRDLRRGSGAPAERGSTVQVRYAGWLADGTPIDSVGVREEPLSFRVGSHTVIRGWEDGLVGMRVGGRRQLVIPAPLGYGARASGPIPANATLVFRIDLVSAQ